MEAGQTKSSLCSLKNVTKFCLVYYTTLLVLIIVFTAINNEPMNSREIGWWWAFLCSLFATAAMSLTALIIMIYTDSYKVNNLDTENDPSGTARSRIPTTTGNQSYKTVLTISSRDPNVTIPKSPTSQKQTLQSSATQPISDQPFPAEQNNNNFESGGFINLSAPPENRSQPNVTVVDIPAINAKRNILRNNNINNNDNNNDYKMPSNLATLPSATILKNIENGKKDKKRNQKLRREAKKKR